MSDRIAKASKIDLHCHLDGSISLPVMQELLADIGESYPENELRTMLQAPDDCTSLAQYLERFALPIRCIQTKSNLRKVAYGLAKDAAMEHVTYLETRFAPSFSTAEGLSVVEIIESVQAGLKQAEEEFQIKTGIIVCGMRHLSMETNLQMLKEARELYGAGVVACDLAGDEKAFPTTGFHEFFTFAKKMEVPFTIHSGECGSRDNIRDAIEFGAKRLGHGIAMSGDVELMKLCASKKIGAEMCPTSNLQTKAIRTWAEYPYREFYSHQVPISINTDNRTVSGTNSTTEFERLQQYCSMTEEEMKRIYEWSVDMAFATDDVKHELLKKWGI